MTADSPSSTHAAAEAPLDLDSTYFVAFEMAHEALRRGLGTASRLNATQYRVLTKLLQATKPLRQGDLGEVLRLKPNVVTQAVDVLERERFVTRTTGTADGRTRFLQATEAGAQHVAAVNQALVDSLYTNFPTENPTYRTILEAAVAAGAQIEPPLHRGKAQKFPASRALVSVELIRQETERVLKEATGASFNECRIVQRLSETGQPERAGVLAEALMMSPVNAARATERLVQRGWAQRLKSPRDKKAVYVALTDEGVYQANVINATVNELGQNKLWANLTPDQRQAIEKVGHVVVADLNARKQAREQADLAALTPVK